MGRMHTPGKGMSGSALPYKRSSPSWLKITSQEVNDIIALIKKRLPRRRWCCLNSEHFGSLFSVSALIDVPMADIAAALALHHALGRLAGD
mgnify:CR=1 FL=1